MNTTYQTLYNLVIDYIKAYRQDLTKHDQHTLSRYDGPFIHIARPTGTNLIKLPQSETAIREYMQLQHLTEIKNNQNASNLIAHLHIVNYEPGNKVYHYFDGKTIKRINQREAAALVNSWYDRVNYVCKNYEYQDQEQEFLTDLKQCTSRYSELWHRNDDGSEMGYSDNSEYIDYKYTQATGKNKEGEIIECLKRYRHTNSRSKFIHDRPVYFNPDTKAMYIGKDRDTDQRLRRNAI